MTNAARSESFGPELSGENRAYLGKQLKNLGYDVGERGHVTHPEHNLYAAIANINGTRAVLVNPEMPSFKIHHDVIKPLIKKL